MKIKLQNSLIFSNIHNFDKIDEIIIKINQGR